MFEDNYIKCKNCVYYEALYAKTADGYEEVHRGYCDHVCTFKTETEHCYDFRLAAYKIEQERRR